MDRYNESRIRLWRLGRLGATIKVGFYLETLGRVETIVPDKTHTARGPNNDFPYQALEYE